MTHSGSKDIFSQTEQLAGFHEFIGLASDLQRRYSQAVENWLHRQDIQQTLSALNRWMRQLPRLLEELDAIFPPNLKGLGELESVISLTHDEGIPVTWVPRQQITQMLIDAPDPVARKGILAKHSDDILEDCKSALQDCESALADCQSAPHDRYWSQAAMCGEWSEHCLDAIRTFARGLYGPAQSHAANIIDSIVLHLATLLGGNRKRAHITTRAQEDINNQSLHTVSHYLTLKPLIRAYVSWFPDAGIPPPGHFARHTTAHALGYPDVTNKDHALLAIMLATSLTRQFSHDFTRVT